MNNKRKQSFFRRRGAGPRGVLIGLFLLLLSTLPASSYAEQKPINAFNGTDWTAWEHKIKYIYIIGFLNGSYTVQQGAGNMGFLSAAEVDQLQLALPRSTTVGRIVSELDRFYASEDHRIPLTVAFVLRNERGLPRWSILERRLFGFSYKEALP